jgi:glycerol uptake facilitator-like aquaporin
MFRKFPWKKVPLYILAQVLGAFFGSLFVYADYFNAINLFEGGNGIRTVPGTASLFASYSVSFRLVELIKRIPIAFARPVLGAIHVFCELLLR